MEYYSAIESTDTCYSMDEPWKLYAKWRNRMQNVFHDTFI